MKKRVSEENLYHFVSENEKLKSECQRSNKADILKRVKSFNCQGNSNADTVKTWLVQEILGQWYWRR